MWSVQDASRRRMLETIGRGRMGCSISKPRSSKMQEALTLTPRCGACYRNARLRRTTHAQVHTEPMHPASAKTQSIPTEDPRLSSAPTSHTQVPGASVAQKSTRYSAKHSHAPHDQKRSTELTGAPRCICQNKSSPPRSEDTVRICP